VPGTLLSDHKPDLHGGRSLESLATGSSLPQEEVEYGVIIDDFGVLQYFDRMLQFVTDCGDQVTVGCLSEIDKDSKDAIRAGHFDRQVEACSDALSAQTLLDIYQPIRRVDPCNEAAAAKNEVLRRISDLGARRSPSCLHVE